MKLTDLIAPGIGLLTFILTGWNAWQQQNTRAAILSLKVELVDRIGVIEGDVKVLEERTAGRRPPTLEEKAA
jgi:hypothetical protein